VRTLIFDFDGTIADSFETFLAIFEEVTNRPQRLTPKEVEDLRGQNLKQIIKYLKIRRWQVPGLIIRAKRLIGLRMGDVHAFDTISQALRQLDGQDYKMYVLSTNSPQNIIKFLKKNQLDGYFVKVYGNIGLLGKSAAIKKILKKEKVRPQDCAYIGDEVRDIEAAKKAGVKSVGVTWGFNSPAAIKQAFPSFVAEKPADLARVFERDLPA
jgi:phosphoglycolate phosphatase